jgi:hypothetical protein
MNRLRAHWAIIAVIGLVVLALAGCGGGGQLSNNADLSDLVPSGGTLVPAFDPDTTEYTIALTTNAAGGMSFTPTAADSGASITINDVAATSGGVSNPVCLNIGDTAMEILVTAENNVNTKLYTVTVTADWLEDVFSGSATTGRDLGPDWTVYGTGTDEMYIDSGWVTSVYNDATNGAGVYAEYNGTVDYAGGLYASALVDLDVSAPLGGDPAIIGGIMINCDPNSWSGYYCQIEWDGFSAYQLVLVEFNGSTAVNTSAQSIAPAFATNTTYLLEIDSNGTSFTAKLWDSTGAATEYASVTLTDNPRTYTDGKVVFYNYVVNSSDNPTGDTLYWTNFYIERY